VAVAAPVTPYVHVLPLGNNGAYADGRALVPSGGAVKDAM